MKNQEDCCSPWFYHTKSPAKVPVGTSTGLTSNLTDRANSLYANKKGSIPVVSNHCFSYGAEYGI